MIALGDNTFKHPDSFVDKEIDYNIFNLIKDNDDMLTEGCTYHRFINGICAVYEIVADTDYEYITIGCSQSTFIMVAIGAMLSGKTAVHDYYDRDGKKVYHIGYIHVSENYKETMNKIVKRINNKELGGMIFSTSGSTGEARDVYLSWYNIMAAIHAFRNDPTIDYSGFDSVLHCVPNNHVYGFLMELLFIILGARAKYATSSNIYYDYLDFKPKVLPVVPAILNKFYEKSLPLNLNLLICAGAPLRLDVAEFYGKTCRQILKGYGTTESAACLTLSTDPKDDGICTAANVIRIADDGELLVKGLSISDSVIGTDGWYHTNDIVSVGSDNRLRIIGRKNNTIKLQQGEFINLDELSILYTTNSIDTVVYANPLYRYPRAIVYIDDTVNREDIPKIFKDIHERNNRKGFERIQTITIRSIKDMPLINGVKPDYKNIREEAIALHV